MRAKISKTAEKKKFFSFFFIGEGVRLLTSLFSWGSFVAGLFFWAFLRGGCPAVFFGGVVGGGKPEAAQSDEAEKAASGRSDEGKGCPPEAESPKPPRATKPKKAQCRREAAKRKNFFFFLGEGSWLLAPNSVGGACCGAVLGSS